MSEKILHFLKELPAWLVLVTVCLFLLILISQTKSEDAEYIRFLERLTEGSFGALLLSLNVRKAPTTNAENVEELNITTKPDATPDNPPKEEKRIITGE